MPKVPDLKDVDAALVEKAISIAKEQETLYLAQQVDFVLLGNDEQNFNSYLQDHLTSIEDAYRLANPDDDKIDDKMREYKAKLVREGLKFTDSYGNEVEISSLTKDSPSIIVNGQALGFIEKVELGNDIYTQTKVLLDDPTKPIFIFNGHAYLLPEDKLGAGENGKVFLALDLETGEAVELQVMKLQFGRIEKLECKLTDDPDIIESADGVQYKVMDTGNTAVRWRNGVGYDVVRVEKDGDKIYVLSFASTDGSIVRKENMIGRTYTINDQGQKLGIGAAEITPNYELLKYCVSKEVLDFVSDTIVDGDGNVLGHVINDDYKVFNLYLILQSKVPGIKLEELFSSKDQLLKQSGPADKVASNAMDVALKLVAELQRFVKDTGAYHCDLRPENIMFDLETQTIKLIDPGAAYKFDPATGIAKTFIGMTPGFTHPDIIEQIAGTSGMAVDTFPYSERHEAYSIRRVIEEYLKAVIAQNPDTAALLNPILAKLGQEWDSFDQMKNLLQQEKVKLQPVAAAPTIKPSNKKGFIPKTERPPLVEGGAPVSARIAALMNAYAKTHSAERKLVETGVSVTELKRKFTNSNKPVQSSVSTPGLKIKSEEDPPRGRPRGHSDV